MYIIAAIILLILNQVHSQYISSPCFTTRSLPII